MYVDIVKGCRQQSQPNAISRNDAGISDALWSVGGMATSAISGLSSKVHLHIKHDMIPNLLKTDELVNFATTSLFGGDTHLLDTSLLLWVLKNRTNPAVLGRIRAFVLVLLLLRNKNTCT